MSPKDIKIQNTSSEYLGINDHDQSQVNQGILAAIPILNHKKAAEHKMSGSRKSSSTTLSSLPSSATTILTFTQDIQVEPPGTELDLLSEERYIELENYPSSSNRVSNPNKKSRKKGVLFSKERTISCDKSPTNSYSLQSVLTWVNGNDPCQLEKSIERLNSYYEPNTGDMEDKSDLLNEKFTTKIEDSADDKISSLEKVLKIYQSIPKDVEENCRYDELTLVARLRNIHQMLLIDNGDGSHDVETDATEVEGNFTDRLEKRINRERSRMESYHGKLGDTEDYFTRKKLKLKSLVDILGYELNSATTKYLELCETFTEDIIDKPDVREKFEKVGLDLLFKRAYVDGIARSHSTLESLTSFLPFEAMK